MKGGGCLTFICDDEKHSLPLLEHIADCCTYSILPAYQKLEIILAIALHRVDVNEKRDLGGNTV